MQKMFAIRVPETSFLLGGTDINDAPLQTAGVVPNPDALAEFNVVTSTLNPEFSRNSGAIINEILKRAPTRFMAMRSSSIATHF